MQYKNESVRSDAQSQDQPNEKTALRSQTQRKATPAVISATVGILLILHGFFIGGLLVLEVAFMSSCSRTVLSVFLGSSLDICRCGLFLLLAHFCCLMRESVTADVSTIDTFETDLASHAYHASQDRLMVHPMIETAT